MRDPADLPDAGDLGPGRGFPGDADDAALEARLSRLLAGSPEADPEGPLPDPAHVASHFAGVGDQGLLSEAAKRPAVRRLLSEVGEDAAAAEAEFAAVRAAAGAKGHVPPRTDPATLVAALEAFDATFSSARTPAGSSARTPAGPASAPAPLAVPSAQVAGGRLRVVASRRGRGLAWAAAAAVLVAIPLALASRAVEAGPVLALSGVDRLDANGAFAVEGPREAGVGARFAPAESERVSLRLPGGSRVVLAGGAAHVVLGDAHAALLALDRGEAVLAAGSEGGAKALVRLPDGSRLEAVRGAAHVALRADGAAAVDVRGGAVVRWTPALLGTQKAGIASRGEEVAGPAAFLIAMGAREIAGREALARDGESLFRDLQFFGGDFVEAPSERFTTARFWRVTSVPALMSGPEGGAAAVRVSDDDGVPALRFDLRVRGEAADVPEARIAWRPDEEALRASRLVVLLRARAASAGAAGRPDPDAPAARVAVLLLGADGAEIARGEVVAGGEDGSARLDLALPADFASRAARGELVLVFRGVAASSVLWFTGATFKPARGSDHASAPSAPASE